MVIAFLNEDFASTLSNNKKAAMILTVEIERLIVDMSDCIGKEELGVKIKEREKTP